LKAWPSAWNLQRKGRLFDEDPAALKSIAFGFDLWSTAMSLRTTRRLWIPAERSRIHLAAKGKQLA
jgi:hypothetical protein